MKYQIKEALDRINEITSIHPNSLQITHTQPGEIEIQCVDDSQNEHKFKYHHGVIHMWDKIEKTWIKVPEGYPV